MTPISLRNLSVLAYSNGFELWHYRVVPGFPGPQNLSEVLAPGAFAIATMLKAGDMIHISAGTQGAIAYVTALTPEGPVLTLMSAT